ncbi:hypothetical protein PRK78_001755 [Emydomyces testavorans]|uniref:PNPLA domain-containing protein n=1 Tax=Emydomyces testavorans TaxID=2070801 RepID=A0AAF0DD90_9EURO|nr:hypothetical protein PRK78_001755 [Emydomyces testavorans]
MSVAETRKQYILFSEDVFRPKRSSYNPARAFDFYQANGKFDHIPLEHRIKELVKAKTGSEDTLLQDDDEATCKVFVTAIQRENTDATVFRSYDTESVDLLYDYCKIWEGARATTAASTFFEPITIGPFKQEFVDGGMRCNNPIELAEFESQALWPNDDRLIISIGSGSAPGKSLDGNIAVLIEALKAIVLDSEAQSERFFKTRQSRVKEDRLFRFNVFHGLEGIGLEEYQEVARIAAATNSYLNLTDVRLRVETCVKVLTEDLGGGAGSSMIVKQ